MNDIVGIFLFCVVYILADGLYYRFSFKKDHITHRMAGLFGLGVATLLTLFYVLNGGIKGMH